MCSTARSRNVWCAYCHHDGAWRHRLRGDGEPRVDGVSLPVLIAPATAASVEVVFNTKTPIEKTRWQAIVIHHTGSRPMRLPSLGAADAVFGLAAMGDHFVIGNGNGLEDGELHVGARGSSSLPCAHERQPGDWANRNAIGICLVGDGDRGRFSDASDPAPLTTDRRAGPANWGSPRTASCRDDLVRAAAPVSSSGRGFREQLAAR